MGITNQKAAVKQNRQARRRATANFLIDPGAVHSVVPGATLRKVGIRAYRQMDFALADGTTITGRVGDAYFELNGEGGVAAFLFGEEGAFKRQLIPMRMLLV